ncbi:MAG: endopeptidase La [Helicobacteraceae bacterium 4484_230]|nr:MAG: endopeptidase La [Helicobacteraceae bacterium 4484_230]
MQQDNYTDFPANLPIIFEDQIFLYPFMITPLFLGDESNINAAAYAIENDLPIIVCPTKPEFEGQRSFEAMYDIGVVGSIMRKVALPDGRVKILFQGLSRARILEHTSQSPFQAVVDTIETEPVNALKMDALLKVIREKVRVLSQVSNYFPPDLLHTIEENHEYNRIIDLICSAISMKKEQAYSLFIEQDMEKRSLLLIDYLIEEIEANKLQKEIRLKVNSKMEQTNKEYFLKEQLKEIQHELGLDTQREEEIEEYRKKLSEIKESVSKDAYKEIHKQIERFARMHPDSADAGMIQNYLEWALEIPFADMARKTLNIQDVERQLESDHFSLTKPKERIAEFFSVRELMELRGIKAKEGSGAILCFAGPPGVGKTSLANSIATALKRPLVRIALGGLEDVNELRGHRRTYIGAMPGRIVQGIIDAKKMNPVIVLDEIDKVAQSHRGDPTAALLEILDPEQNSSFRDYYLNFDIDLSNVIFIATANDVGRIPAPLRDRMEFIGLSEDPKLSKVSVSIKNIDDFMDKKVFEINKADAVDKIGVVNGLAWTAVGGDVLKIETIRIKGKGLMQVTGSLGEVMKESARIAMSVVKTMIDNRTVKVDHAIIPTTLKEREEQLTIDASEVYKRYDLHIHIPDGATPKDGPSAGIAMAAAIASILSNQKVRAGFAMTGELSLSGVVLPIGGLREKLIAAHRAGVHTVLIPKKNFERDLEDIPDEVKESLAITAVERIEEVMKILLIEK